MYNIFKKFNSKIDFFFNYLSHVVFNLKNEK
jgi:hypothetical protein